MCLLILRMFEKVATRRLFSLLVIAVLCLQPLLLVVGQNKTRGGVKGGPATAPAPLNSTSQSLPFAQDWTNTGLITTNDNWSGVPGIEGFLGQDLTTATGTDPQTLLGTSAAANDLTVIANQTNTAITNGDVAEFELTNPTIALQGSGTADAPYLLFHINTTGQSNINISYNLRDIDCTTDNAVSPVALQYRVGNTGNFTNVAAGFVADASTGPSLCSLVTPINVTLPAAVDNQSLVQIRIMTTNAVGNDEWIGVDDINITSGVVSQPSVSINDVSLVEGNMGTTTFSFTVSLNAPAGAGGVTFDIATQDNTATTGDNDYVTRSLTGQTIASGNTTYMFDVTVNGDTNVEPNESFYVNVTNATGANVGDGQGLGTIQNDDIALAAIHSIQGSGSSSPLAGQVVTTSGTVTGRKSNGFFVQEPDATVDADPTTSEGIFVFTSSAPPAAAAIGNNVQVTGTVAEFVPSSDPFQKPLTELTSPTVVQLSTGNPLPVATEITAADTTVNNVENLEKLEGMRVSVSSLTVVAPTQGFINEPNATVSSNGIFYGVITGVPRPFREPGVNISDPLPAGAPANVPRFDENPERLRVDSDAQPGTTAVDVTAGTLITNVVGVLDYAFRTYTILPEATLVPDPPATFTPVPTGSQNELTVGSFNMQRFFDTVNDPNVSDAVLTTTAFNNRLNKASQAVRQVMRSPDVIGIVEMENLSTLQAVATKINDDTAGETGRNPNYQAYLVEGNDIGGIDVGFLIKASHVNVVDVTQIELPGCVATAATCNTFINPNTGLAELLNDRPPLVLRATINRPTGGTMAFTVIVNHLRSLNGIDDTSPNGSGTEGGRVRAKRKAQAEFLANYIQSRQTTDPTEKIISVGDYNAFQFNDGYVDVIGTIKGTPAPADQVVLASSDLVNPDLTAPIDTLPNDQRYSFTFDGNAQALDHILVNRNALAGLSRFAIGRNDADFPQEYYEDPNRPERLSDHDMPVAYFTLVTPVVISEFRFRGPTFNPAGFVNGARDEYIELYNNSGSPLTINSGDGSSGWSVAYLNSAGTVATIAAVIPNGTVIPAQGHYLLTNEPGSGAGNYTLTPYAASDQMYGSIDIPDDSAIGLFQTSNPANLLAVNKVDAVSLNSSAGPLATLYREGTSLTSPGANDGQYAFTRRLKNGTPQDTDNNSQDFVFVSTNAAAYGGVQSVLGAPGPENRTSPIQRNAQLTVSLIEPNQSAALSPNRVRDFTPTTNGALGTLSIRRRFTNVTANPVTMLRFRIVELTTLNSPGYSPGGAQADLRALDGSSFDVTTSIGSLTVNGSTIEQPSPLLQPIGGGLNSTWTVAIPGGTLEPGASIDLHFLLGVQQSGIFRFYINVEVLP